MNYLYPTTDKQVAENVKELNKLIFLDLMNLGLPICNKGTNHLKNIIILGVLNAENDYNYQKTLEIYCNEHKLNYLTIKSSIIYAVNKSDKNRFKTNFYKTFNFDYDYSFKTPFNIYENFVAKYQIKIISIDNANSCM